MRHASSTMCFFACAAFLAACQAPEPQASQEKAANAASPAEEAGLADETSSMGVAALPEVPAPPAAVPEESNQAQPEPAPDVATPEESTKADPQPEPRPDEQPARNLLRDEQTFGDVTVRLLGPEDVPCETTVEVSRSGESVYTRDEEGHVEFPEGASPVQDFTRDGIPDLALISYSGGAHCCYMLHVLSLGTEVREVLRLDAQDAGVLFKDEDADGVSEFHTRDDIWAYWGECYAGSPRPAIVLTFASDEKIAFAESLMRQPVPDEQEWQQRLDSVKAAWAVEAHMRALGSFQKDWGCDVVPPALWKNLQDLIYTGNGELAWRFLDEAWPEDKQGKDAFRKVFEEQLAKSQFKAQIDELNGW